MSSLDQHVIASPFVKGRQHQLKFQLILSEASQLFNWQGSRATTLADIAGTMNLTKTCLYYYVRNKEDLVHKCYVASCDMWLRRAVEANAQKGSGLDKIIFMIGGHLQQYAATVRDESPHFALLTEVSSLNDECRQDIVKRWSEIFVLCQSMVEEGIEQGVIADLDPSVVALAIFSIIQWFPVWMNRKHAANASSVMASVLSLVTNGLASEPHEFEDIDFPAIGEIDADSFNREIQNHNKREAFYRVGSAHFNQKGYKGTSLDEIASSLDVTKGAFYYHIKNKEELLYQCFNRTLDLEGGLLSEAGEVGKAGLKKVELSLRYLFHIQFSDQGPLIRYRALPSLGQDHRKRVLKATKENSDKLGAYIRQGLIDGTVRNIDPEITQNMLSGAVEASPELADWLPDLRGKDLSSDYFYLFINGLSNKSTYYIK